MAKMKKLDDKTYGQFISETDLVDVRLIHSLIEAKKANVLPKDTDLKIDENITYEPALGGFEAKYVFKMTFESFSDKAETGRIEVTFGIAYKTGVSVEDKSFAQLFDRFKETDLRLDSWPYIREYVASSMARMGWPPLMLPSI